MSEQRIVRIRVTPRMIAEWFVTGAEINMRCVKGVPPDARFEGAAIDSRTLDINLYFSHQSFPRRQGGEVIIFGAELEDTSEDRLPEWVSTEKWKLTKHHEVEQ